MFALGAHDLSRRTLGCADGPASFNAEATARGGRVVSCDPLYQFTRAQIASRIAEVPPTMLEQTRANAHGFVWDRFASVEELGRARHAARGGDTMLRCTVNVHSRVVAWSQRS